MKKIIRYMQSTAVSYSDDKFSSAAYLSARGKEPQQRAHQSKTHAHHMSHAEKRVSHPSMHAHTIPAYTSGARGPYPVPSEIQKFQYGRENILQSVEVYVPKGSPHLGRLGEESGSSEESSGDSGRLKPESGNRAGLKESPVGTGTHTPTPRYWIIYVHGGYFRDPKVDSSSFHPALGQLINPSHDDGNVRSIQGHIAGYASVNYRLSPHQAYPQGEEVEEYERREAKWPEHIDDVMRGIAWLQGKYGFGERYLLVGHSVGATMAMLVALKGREGGRNGENKVVVQPPLAVLGVCGIYDFEKLHEKYGKDYEYLTRNAGMDAERWKEASPAVHGRDEYEGRWSNGRKRWCLLAQSKGDGLVDWGQVELMQKVFEDEGKEGGEVLVDVMEVKGKHDDVWRKGGELARVIALGVGEMMGLDQ